MQSDVTRVSFATAKSDKKSECNYFHHLPPSFHWIVIEEFLKINVCILIKNMSTTKLCKQIHFEKFSTRFSSFMFNIKQICRTHERERKRERVWGGLKKLLKREWTKRQKGEKIGAAENGLIKLMVLGFLTGVHILPPSSYQRLSILQLQNLDLETVKRLIILVNTIILGQVFKCTYAYIRFLKIG